MLRRLLADRAEEIATIAWGQPKFKDRNEWRWGANNGSLALVVTNKQGKRGRWYDRQL